MKSIFEKINNGRHPQFSLPFRIELVLPELIDFGDLHVGLVDTRGIDQLTARADLEEHLEDPHTLAILCTGFNDAPEQSIHHLLKRAHDINNALIESNSAILVLARPEEARAVKDEAGVFAETADEGYELKGEQVSGALSPYHLSEIPVAFYNSREDEPTYLREFLNDRLSHIRDGFRADMNLSLDRARHALENAEMLAVLEVQREASRHLTSWIDQHQGLGTISGHVYDTLLDELGQAHPSTVRAAVSRRGEWQSLSYSHQLSHGARKVAVVALHTSVKDFKSLCKTLTGSMPEAGELLSQASRLMNSAYEELLRKMPETSSVLFQNPLRNDSAFWAGAAGEWGRGPGYRNRVLIRSRDWFSEAARRELENQLEDMLAAEWTKVLTRVNAIFDSS